MIRSKNTKNEKIDNYKKNARRLVRRAILFYIFLHLLTVPKKKEKRALGPRFSILRRRHEVVQLRLQPDDLSLRSIGAALGTLQRGVFV